MICRLGRLGLGTSRWAIVLVMCLRRPYALPDLGRHAILVLRLGWPPVICVIGDIRM